MTVAVPLVGAASLRRALMADLRRNCDTRTTDWSVASTSGSVKLPSIGSDLRLWLRSLPFSCTVSALCGNVIEEEVVESVDCMC